MSNLNPELEYNSEESDTIFDPNAPSEHEEGMEEDESSDESESVAESQFVDHNIEAEQLPDDFSALAMEQELKKTDFMHSLVKITCTSHDFSFKQPWQAPRIGDAGGTGFIIGGNRILTNAHVIDGHRYIKVEIGEAGEQFTADVELVGNDCDLAILTVKDPEFWKDTKPMQIGHLTGIEKKVKVLGFPVGGDEMSTTKGIVSRIQVDTYEQAERNLLSVQVDAAINPGNSGGPVIAKNALGQYEVVGVAFQGLDGVQNCGYMIPPPVINHFLEEANHLLEDPERKYIGFPEINIVYQEMKSKALRQFFGMQAEETGVRVQSIDDLSTAKDMLEVDDVILEIDGHQIKNDGMIKHHFKEIGKELRLHHSFLFHKKFAGESSRFKIRREKAILEIDIELQSAEATQLCQWEFDQQPKYFINSGLVFQTLSLNYLTGGDALEFISDAGDASFEEMTKKSPDDEKIFINKVLRCNATIGYEDEAHSLVKSINGIEVNNMLELIDAMEKNEEEFHRIVTAKDAHIVVKRMTEAEHHKLLSHYSILVDRADVYREGVLDAEEDLDSAAGSSAQHAQQAIEAASASVESEEDAEEEAEEASAPASKKGKGKAKAKAKPSAAVDMEDVGDEEDYQIEGKKLKPEHTLAMMLATADEQGTPRSKSKQKAKAKPKTSDGAKAAVAAAVNAAMAADAGSSSSEDEDFADEEDNVSATDEPEAVVESESGSEAVSASGSDSESDGDFVPRRPRSARCAGFAAGSSADHAAPPIAVMASRSGRKRDAQQPAQAQEPAGVFYQTRSKRQRTGSQDQKTADNG